MPNTYYTADTKSECCSDGGGRKWTLGDTGGSMDSIASGNLVIRGNLIGVALTNYDTATDTVVIDTVGCYNLEVTAHTPAGANVAIEIGDWLIYDVSADAIVRDALQDLAGGDKRIGQAMEALASGTTADICVKLQPTPSLTA